jgi:hypothetical protein
VALGGCGGADDSAVPSQATTNTSPATTAPTPQDNTIPMIAMPPGAARICARRELFGPACPATVPEARYGLAGRPVGFEGPYAEGGFAVCLERANGGCVAEGFHLEGGVPTGNPRGDRPPRFVHLSLYASRRPLRRYFPFDLPCSGPVIALDRADRLLKGRQRNAACLGDEEIAGRPGTLALAPPYPTGGEAGGHVFFLWREGRIARAATLHAWAPVAEAIDVLRSVMASVTP